MHRQAVLVRRSLLASRAVRRYATDSIPPPPPSPAAAQSIPTVNVSPSSPLTQAKPVVVTPVVETTVLEPPPPPPPSSGPKGPRKRPFRRFLIYTSLATVLFYGTSGLISTHSDSYRDFFTSTFPLGEQIADYADDNEWDRIGLSSLFTGAQKASSLASDGVHKVKQITGLEEKPKTVTEKAEDKVKAAANKIGATKDEAAKSTKDELAALRKSAAEAREKAAAKAAKAAEAIKHKSEELKEKAVAAVESVPTVNFTDGVAEIVGEAEKALGIAKKEAKDAVEGATAPTPELSNKQPWTGPLPIGFEPPPGYYVPKPVAPAAAPGKDANKLSSTDAKDTLVKKIQPHLPLLAPEVKDFPSSADEPIISQLASTIDSLASSLSATSSASTPAPGATDKSPAHILSKAKEDLSSLASRLEGLKAHEKAQLEETAKARAKEFESVLKSKAEEWREKEGELMKGWEEEKGKLVDGWRKVLDRELEGQRAGIEQRLREEVVAQGIELQRRWLRSIKAQVETERGGRLAKLDHLNSSFKQLERITLDNSTQLDANLSLHALWSALRAVQAKADKGGAPFDDELRVLKSAAQAQSARLAEASAGAELTDAQTQAVDVINTMITSIESTGIAQTGVKSLPFLATWFTSSLEPKLQSVSLVPEEHQAGVLSHVASALLSKVLFTRKAGFVQGDDVGAVLARAEWYLNQKDLDGAAREVNQLKGWAGKLAGDWLAEARKRLTVEQALEVVAAEATLSSLLLV